MKQMDNAFRTKSDEDHKMTKMDKGTKLENRLAAYSIFLFCFFVFVFTFCTIVEKTGKDILGTPFGIDFGVYYTAGQMVQSGDVANLYNTTIQHAALEINLNRILPPAPWLYPPTYLLIITPLASLPYTVALVTWLIITFALAIFALFLLVPRRKTLVLLAIGFPGVLMNLRWGQNGFLNTALLGFGLYFLESNPMVAGLMFGLLTYKPQIALFAFIVLFVSKKWRVLAWAVVSSIIFALLSGIVFGLDTWVQFFQTFSTSAKGLLDNTWYGLAGVQPSMFINLCLAGIKDSINYIVLGVTGIAVASATGWVWKHTERIALKATTLCVGTFLIIPYFLQYDLMILSIPLVLLAYDCMEYGSRPVDFLMLFVLWAIPTLDLVSIRLATFHICPFILMALIIWVIARIKRSALQSELSCQFLATSRRAPKNQTEIAKENALN